jgi:hypothetical protein
MEGLQDKRVSVRVSFEEKETRVLAIAPALALTLALFQYPEPACRQAAGRKLQPVQTILYQENSNNSNDM